MNWQRWQCFFKVVGAGPGGLQAATCCMLLHCTASSGAPRPPAAAAADDIPPQACTDLRSPSPGSQVVTSPYPGDISDHVIEGVTHLEFVQSLVQAAQQQGCSANYVRGRHVYGEWGAHAGFKIAQHHGQPLHTTGETLGQWYERRFGEPWLEQEGEGGEGGNEDGGSSSSGSEGSGGGGPWWYVGALFAVSRLSICSRPRELYQALMQETAVANAPEVGHFLERAWWLVFNGGGKGGRLLLPPACVSVAGRPPMPVSGVEV